jgi:7-alpha-hydroxysteroid dehydrogenase
VRLWNQPESAMGGMLEGRTAIVTGAGGGVGLAVAQRFADEGATLMLTDRDEAALDAAEAALRDAGARVASWSCDLSQKLGIANLLASATDHFGEIDILINGTVAPFWGAPMEADVATLDAAYHTNLRATFMLCQAVAQRMVDARAAEPDRPDCAIVNLTSTAAQRTLPEMLPYSVSCAALDQLTRSLAVALADRRVRVNGVALGAVMTRALAAAMREQDGLRAALERATPMSRIGEAGEAAEAVLYLASPRASFITGQILSVDGGRMVLDPLATPTE